MSDFLRLPCVNGASDSVAARRVRLDLMLVEKRKGQGGRFRGQLCVSGGIPAGVMCLKSITPIARISVCAEKESVCVCFP